MKINLAPILARQLNPRLPINKPSIKKQFTYATFARSEYRSRLQLSTGQGLLLIKSNKKKCFSETVGAIICRVPY